MTKVPDPLTPADCDLRGMEWMPMFGSRLFTSDFEARASDEVFRAAVRLWWMAWQQVPAASLPDDDFVLCKLAGLGRDMKTWKRFREFDALHGFTLCSDGRLYHGLLAEQAREAWDRRVRERGRKAAYRASKNHSGSGGTGNGHDADVPRDKSGTGRGPGLGLVADVPVPVRSDRTGQDRTGTGQSKKGSELRSAADGGAKPPPDVRNELWAEGLTILRGLIGKSDQQSRALLGKLLKTANDDCAVALDALRRAADLRPVDPISWISRAVEPRLATGRAYLETLAEDALSEHLPLEILGITHAH